MYRPATTVFPTSGSASVPTRPAGGRRRLRELAAGALACVGLLVFAGPAAAATTTARVGLADWSTGSSWPGWGWSGGGWSGGAWSAAGGPDDGTYGWPGQGSDGSGAVDSSPATAAESKGVVLIDTALRYQGAEGAGTGMVLTSSGQVLTNYHVVEGATAIRVTVASTGRTYTATVVGHDETHDVALLQLKGASGLQTVTVEDHSVAVGDAVTAVGNAGGTGSLSAADGTVTSLTASVTTAAEGPVASETLTKMIETSADVVAGDSGGPLIDTEGDVIGIDTAASTGAEIDGYAIPIEKALSIVDQIRTGTGSSTVQVGPSAFLGVLLSGSSSTGADTYGDRQSFSDGLSDGAGATVSDVVAGSPAAEAGLSAGDLITAVGSSIVTSAEDVSAALAGHRAGDKITIIWTDTYGAGHRATLTLAASPVA
ncbi:MAG TPA: trypsin-like peptidase domain-containing protein [Microlunatus sp.]|nr:trypsin-like peptidase domain-containing protein [Microlunatus sp.]